eukprot:m.227231 g.227231  ORF g.227231 m.227231 type:complete len:237 (-) comp26414_c0_seq2:967-1677(-)
MSEAWGSIVMELSEKVKAFDRRVQQPAGQISSSLDQELLNLLTKGQKSPELEGFLASPGMNARELKNMDATIMTAYSTLQSLVMGHLNNVVRALMFRFSNLEGYSRHEEKFGEETIGLAENLVTSAVSTIGSLALKVDELLRVIDTSKGNFKAFSTWLALTKAGEQVDLSPAQGPSLNASEVASFIRTHLGQALKRQKRELSTLLVVAFFSCFSLAFLNLFFWFIKSLVNLGTVRC